MRLRNKRVNGAHPILRVKGQEYLELTLTAGYDPRNFVYDRSLAGQMEVYYGYFHGLTGSQTRAASAGFSPYALFANLGRFQPGFSLDWSRTTGDRAGINPGGAVGGGSNWLTEGDIPFSIQVTA